MSYTHFLYDGPGSPKPKPWTVWRWGSDSIIEPSLNCCQRPLERLPKKGTPKWLKSRKSTLTFTDVRKIWIYARNYISCLGGITSKLGKHKVFNIFFHKVLLFASRAYSSKNWNEIVRTSKHKIWKQYPENKSINTYFEKRFHWRKKRRYFPVGLMRYRTKAKTPF